MLSRKPQELDGISLPPEWISKVRTIINDSYDAERQVHKKNFQVYAYSYPNEVILMVTFCDDENILVPVTYMASADLTEKQKPLELLETLVDSIGVFFDQYFNNPDWNDYMSKWEETSFKSLNFFYKVTRENIGIFLITNKFLMDNKE